jgi:hypothetical protein
VLEAAGNMPAATSRMLALPKFLIFAHSFVASLR